MVYVEADSIVDENQLDHATLIGKALHIAYGQNRKTCQFLNNPHALPGTTKNETLDFW